MYLWLYYLVLYWVAIPPLKVLFVTSQEVISFIKISDETNYALCK